jgi:hypothetical protein
MLKVATVTTFVFAMVVCPIAFVRIVRARTRLEYLKAAVLFIAPIVVTFELAHLAGALPESRSVPPLETHRIRDLFAHMPRLQLVVLLLACGVWLFGANVLFHRHAQRLGKTLRQTMNPLEPPLKDLNPMEWFLLAALAVVAVGLGILAASL